MHLIHNKTNEATITSLVFSSDKMWFYFSKGIIIGIIHHLFYLGFFSNNV